jgi:hypothetical protein
MQKFLGTYIFFFATEMENKNILLRTTKIINQEILWKNDWIFD